MEPETYAAGVLALQSGVAFPDARIAYVTFGALNAARDNAVIFPTRFGGTHEDNLYLIGEDRALDPREYFIVVPNLIGNGVSSSPSNTGGAFAHGHFPAVSIYDNVLAQHRLATEVLGIERFALVLGWSMGGQQAYQWASLYPDRVARLAVICGAARTAPHTHVFMEGMKAALTADAAWAGGAYREPPERGLRAIGRAWAGWGFSQAFYRAEMFRELGYISLEDFLVRYWEGLYMARDANNILTMLATWRSADVGANERYRGDYAAAMGAIEARTLLMPGRTDLYFPPEDAEAEAELLRRAEIKPIESVWGHYAGGGRSEEDLRFLTAALRELLESD
ncbi:MAG TPA: alpha/beta fold hydrolase [Solirubrobacteraceae bacterium]|nr:alpha/beta fold hydrolase [Solirubrobacteraceae bacterium]